MSAAEKFTRLAFLSLAFGLSFSIAWAHASLFFLGLGWILWRFLGNGPSWSWAGLAWPLGLFAATALTGAWAGLEYGFHGHDLAKALGLPFVLPLTATLAGARPEWVRPARRVFLGGLGIHSLYALVLWLVEARLHGLDRTRLHGSFSMPLTFAEVMAMGILLHLATREEDRGTRLASWLLPGAGLAFFLTYGRGAFLGFLGGALILLAFKKPRAARTAAALALVLVLAWAWAGPRLLGERGAMAGRLGHAFDDSSFSNRARLDLWVSGLRMIRERPLGVGPGGVYEALPQYKVEDPGPWGPKWAASQFGHLHNTYLQTAAERGWLGVLALGFLLLVIFKSLRERARESGGLAGAVLAAAAAFLVSGLTEHVLGDSSAAMTFWFLTGLALPSQPS